MYNPPGRAGEEVPVPQPHVVSGNEPLKNIMKLHVPGWYYPIWHYENDMIDNWRWKIKKRRSIEGE
jgi:hypothetical protein